MMNNYCNNPGSSRPGGRSRGASHGYTWRIPMNATIASSAIINNGFVGGFNNGIPVEFSKGTTTGHGTNNGNNHGFPRAHQIVTPMIYSVSDPFPGSPMPYSGEYTTELATEYTSTSAYATDEDCPTNTDIGIQTPSEIAGLMKHYELLHSFEELNAKVHNRSVLTNDDEPTDSSRCAPKAQDMAFNTKDDFSSYFQQIKAAHLLRKIGKFSVNNTHPSTSINEPKHKNVEQQTDVIRQRNVSQQTYSINQNNSDEEVEQACQPNAKKKKTCDCKSLDRNKRHEAVESMRLPTGKVDLKGVAGLTEVKIIIRETFLLPLTHPHLFNLFEGAVKRCCRCLLYGPPGTGKTLLAQAIASELGAGLYYVSCAGILSCYIGESEKNVKELFEYALEQEEPSIIFFDEIDSVCRKRTEGESEHSRRLKTELLKYFENPAMEESKVYILSATNCPWDLDTAFLRRFQRHIYVPLPDREARQQIISQHLGELTMLLCEDDWDQILNQTHGFSGSDLCNFVSISVAQPNREILRATHWKSFDGEHVIPCESYVPNAFPASVDDVPPEKVMARSIMLSDFLYAAQETSRTVTDEHIQQFEDFKRQFSR